MNNFTPAPTHTPLLLPPAAYGLPSKFVTYRPFQDSAIIRGVAATKRVVAQCAPVGFGKSMNAILQGVLSGRRTVILTATKGLQDQYYREFSQMGLVDQRGRDNYPYPENPHNETCESGPCMGGSVCKFRNAGCPYDEAVFRFNASKLAVTNYAWWLAVAPNPSINTPELLVLDEAHDAPHQLENALAFTLYDTDIRKYCTAHPPDEPTDEFFITQPWAQWAGAQGAQCIQSAQQLAAIAAKGKPLSYDQSRAMKTYRRLGASLLLLARASGDCLWVWERLENPGGWQFNPLNPAQFAEQYLFRGVPKILLTSGTLTPKTCETLGLTPDNTDYQDYPSPFDPTRAPIYQYSTGIRWDSRTNDSDVLRLIAMMDAVIDARLDRKGIVHSVSYKRQRVIYSNSRHAGIMWGNSPKGSHNSRTTGTGTTTATNTSAAQVVEAFKQHPNPPAVLVSPTVTTGWDFPGKQCEYQIICKLPFPDASSRIMQARARVDPDYAAHLCAVELQQMCGRGMRTPEDRCETLIMDDHSRWFLGKHRGLFNASFWQFLRRCDAPPPAPPRLG